MPRTKSSQKSKKVCVIGAGGHARSVINLIRHNGLQPTGFYDESMRGPKENIAGFPVLGKIKDVPKQGQVVLAIGNNELRKKLLGKFATQVFKDNLIHPTAVIEQDVTMGKYNQVMAGVYINSFANVGDNNILNTGCVLEHEAVLGNHSHLSVGAIVCGRSVIGDRCLIGAGAIIIDRIKVCDDVLVGAGAVVIKDITSPGTYVGNPARKIK